MYPCNFCEATLASKQSLTRHVNAKHRGVPKVHVCLVCNKDFASKQSLERHIKRLHNDGEQKQTCIIHALLQNFEKKIMILQKENESANASLRQKISKQQEVIHAQNKKITLLERRFEVVGAERFSQNIANCYNCNINNINVTLNVFGAEDRSSLTQRKLLALLSRTAGCMSELTQLIHVQNRSNRNLFIPNVRVPVCCVLRADEQSPSSVWRYEHLPKILTNIVETHTEIITNFLKENKEFVREQSHGEAKINRIQDFLDKIPKRHEQLRKDVHLVLINYRDTLKPISSVP